MDFTPVDTFLRMVFSVVGPLLVFVAVFLIVRRILVSFSGVTDMQDAVSGFFASLFAMLGQIFGGLMEFPYVQPPWLGCLAR